MCARAGHSQGNRTLNVRKPLCGVKKSRPADMCGWTGHNQGNLPLRVCEAARPSAWFSGKFCPQGDIRGKEFLPRDCAQKWVPPKAWRFCGTLKKAPAFAHGRRRSLTLRSGPGHCR